MKNISLWLIIFFGVFLCNAQSQRFELNWSTSKVFSRGNTQIELPYFDAKNYNFSHENGITYTAQWKAGFEINTKNVSITALETEAIPLSELKDLKLSSIPEGLQFEVFNSKNQGKLTNTIEISAVFKDNDIIKKVKRFTIDYKQALFQRSMSSQSQVQNSVLKTGQWYRFQIDTTGVYKLNKSFFNALGVNTNTVNPKNIKIFGHGGRSLPLVNNQTVAYDLIENAVQFVGEDDGVFNNSDYLLFYAIGPKSFNQENNSHINPYSDTVYYYVQISNGDGLRMNAANTPTGAADATFSTFHDYKFVESDTYNIGQMGRRWFGHRFYFENARTFSFDFPNLVTQKPLKLKILAAAVAESNTNLEVKANGTVIDNFSFNAIDNGILATEDLFSGNINSSSDVVTIDLNYNNNGNPSAIGYLDYISIEAERELKSLGQQFQFKHNDMPTLSGIGEFVISNASGISEVWDISDPYNPQYYKNTNAAADFSFKTPLGTEKIFHALESVDLYTPTIVANKFVANQDLKGTIFLNQQQQFEDIDYLIITPRFLENQAEQLATINREKNNLNVKVVTLESIYQEFSSGMQDIAGVRNFVKYVYDNANDPNKRLRYLCMFGDASFDYKNRIPNNTNIAPSWYSINSFNLTNSFISDDFYGMMDDNEGAMNNSDKLDLAVGRILAETPQRAQDMVNKIKSYYNKEAYGNWRNNFLLISDDIDKLSDKTLQETTDFVADDVRQAKPFLNVTKIHTDAYQQETSSGGDRYPKVNDAIFDAIEVGAIAVNYFGHGGEDGLALERIFDKINAQELKNPNKLNCFVTLTCEYTKFDNPLRDTAGEFLYWNKNGGAISLISTTRQIFISVGVQFTTTLSQYLFDYNNTQNISMAEALRLTKNNPGVTNNTQRRLVFFIGDPAMKLPLAAPDIIVTKVNDEDIATTTQELQALSAAKIEGYVADDQGAILSDYSGTLTATIFDKNIQRSTLGNDGTSENGQLIIMDFETMGEVIFRGQATVENGVFEINFIVPKDISVPVGNGKISLYSKTENPLTDQRGYSFDIKIGGVNLNAPEDNTGPNIQLFMNDESFVSGGITNENPTLLVKLFDENGINTASGVGHDIVATLDGDETNPFILNDYYVTDPDTYQSGSLSYPFRDLSPGLHTLTLKAWDVYNNASTKEIQFVVFDQNQSLELKNVLNYPNPFINYTEFWFNHNSSDILNVSIQIFTVSGKLIKTINTQTNTGSGISSLSRDITWDGTDDFGNKVGKGVYVYKLNVKSPATGRAAEKIEKLVIL